MAQGIGKNSSLPPAEWIGGWDYLQPLDSQLPTDAPGLLGFMKTEESLFLARKTIGKRSLSLSFSLCLLGLLGVRVVGAYTQVGAIQSGAPSHPLQCLVRGRACGFILFNSFQGKTVGIFENNFSETKTKDKHKTSIFSINST